MSPPTAIFCSPKAAPWQPLRRRDLWYHLAHDRAQFVSRVFGGIGAAGSDGTAGSTGAHGSNRAAGSSGANGDTGIRDVGDVRCSRGRDRDPRSGSSRRSWRRWWVGWRWRIWRWRHGRRRRWRRWWFWRSVLGPVSHLDDPGNAWRFADHSRRRWRHCWRWRDRRRVRHRGRRGDCWWSGVFQLNLTRVVAIFFAEIFFVGAAWRRL